MTRQERAEYKPKGTLIEQTVISWLNRYFAAEMPAVKAYAEEPEHKEPAKVKPGRFVTVHLLGGGEHNKLGDAFLAVRSYAPTRYEAAVLDSFVRDAMHRIIELDEVASCKLNSYYDYTREDKDQPRYQSVFDIVHY
jgi:hypothetical protein